MIYLAVALALVTATALHNALTEPFWTVEGVAPLVVYLLGFNIAILVTASLWGPVYGLLLWCAVVIIKNIRQP